MTGTELNSYPITPLEPAISRQKLLQIAREELNKNLSVNMSANGDDTEDDNEEKPQKAHEHHHEEDHQKELDDSENDTDEDTDASSSYDEEEDEEEEEGEDVSIQLVGLNISSLPPELVDLYQSHVSKLSLKNNWLETLPKQFMSMSQLVYLDISNNRLSEFPEVLCQCASLQILDISSNQIGTLPKNLGHLEQLKCLSMFNNRFEYLPPSIADMVDLQILEIEHNPIIAPPRSLFEPKPAPHEQLEWIDSIKQYLKSNRDQLYALIDKKQSSSGTDESSFQLQPPPARLRPSPPVLMRSVSEAAHSNENASSGASNGSPTNERLRSNSESQASSRAAKRMGFIIKKPNTLKEEESDAVTSPVATTNNEIGDLPTPGDTPQQHQHHHHQRVLSQDSIPSEDHNMLSTRSRQSRSRLGSISGSSSVSGSASPVMDGVSGQYFRRLSMLQENEKSNDALVYYEMQDKIVESSRKILFSLSELHAILRRCSSFCDDKQLLAKITSLSQASKNTFPHLVNALEKLESAEQVRPEEGDKEAVNAVLNASMSSLAAFRNLVTFFRANLDKIATMVDVKYLRSLIMTLYQSFNELHNSWHVMYPTRVISRSLTRQMLGKPAGVPGSLFMRKDGNNTVASPVIEDVLRTGEGLSAADDQLYEKIYQAASTAQTVLGQLTEAVSKSAAASVQEKVSSTLASKVKDLMQTSVTGVEVTKRLMARLDSIRESGGSQIDRRRFWDDLNGFIKAVIGILGSTKSAMNDLPLLDDARPNLMKLTKLAKEVPILVEYSSYKAMMSDGSGGQLHALQQHSSTTTGSFSQQSIQSTTSGMPAPPTTPLVAVLGSNAAQAVTSPSTNPQGYSPFIPENQQGGGAHSNSTSPNTSIERL